MTEIWKDIPNYEGWYQVSNLGRVKSLSRTVQYGDKAVRSQAESILNPRKGGPVVAGKQYLSVVLCKNKARKQTKVHRLVAEAFCNQPEGCDVVNHLDNDPSNNLATNLEWTTIAGNNKHRHVQGRSASLKGESHGSAVLSEKQVSEIKQLLAIGKESQEAIAKRYGICQPHVSRIKLSKSWACRA